MTAATLWIEMTIAGSVYVASLLILIIACYDPKPNLASLASQFHDLLGYAAVAVVGLSYVFGFIFHRFIQILISRKDHWSANREAKNGTKNKVKYRDYVSNDLNERLGSENTIWQYGSTRLQREVDFQFAQLALLRSLRLSIPFLFVSICFWRHQIGWYVVQSTYWIFFAVIYIVLCFAHKRQKLQNKTILQKAIAAAAKLQTSDAPPAQHSEAIVTIRGITLGETDGGCTVTFDGLKVDPPLVQIDKLIPRISSASCPEGTALTITGLNLGEDQGRSILKFNGNEKTAAAWRPTYIQLLLTDAETANLNKELVSAVVTIDGSKGQNYKVELTCPPVTPPSDPPSAAAPTPPRP
jgi:hypothetical protein